VELAAQREAVVEIRARFTKLSERRACGLVGIRRATHRHQSKRKEQDQPLKERLKTLAMEQPRYGYRRLVVLIRRESAEPVNEKRVRRLYREAGLALRRIKRKRLQRSPVPLVKLSEANQEWAMDFVQDWAANGQVLRFLAVVDQYTRKCVRLVVDTSIPSARVIRELESAMAEHGKPERLRMDNGSEFTSRSFLAWCVEQKIEMMHIRPGKPVENAHCESFNGRLREEFLNVTRFQHLWDARAKAAEWLRHYNEHRPHSSLGYRTPNEFAAVTCSALRAPQATALPSAWPC